MSKNQMTNLELRVELLKIVYPKVQSLNLAKNVVDDLVFWINSKNDEKNPQ